MFERIKAITIVRRMICDSETYVNQAKENGFTSGNYYAMAECALLALSVVFSSVYTIKSTLGKRIIKEAVSGSWRQFVSEEHKREYKERIEMIAMQYDNIVQVTFARTGVSKGERLDATYKEICKVLCDSFCSDFTPESECFFSLILVSVQEYIATIVGKRW